MPIDDDDDLFDAPVRTKKPSNKIVHQPAGASWSLDRLPEVETFYQQTFRKRLPLSNKGQGSIHNKWNYDHTNSADVSLNPSSSEGKQLEAKLREMGVPFLAFTSAIPGVATGPHFHLGFPSRRTDKKFNIGAQRKKQSVASDDLFDADSDLFDQDQGQTPPPQTPRNAERSKQPSPSPQVVQKASSVPANRLSQLAVGGVQGRSSTLGVGDLRRLDDPVTQQINRIQRAVTSEQSPAERQMKRAPGTANARLLEPKLTENEEVLRRLSDEQDQAKREQAAIAEQKRLTAQFTPKDKAEIADFVNHLKGKGTTYTGIRTGARSVGASGLYKLAGLADIGNAVQKPITGQDSWLPDFLRKKALAGELSIDEIPAEQRGQVAEFLTQMGLGLAEIAVAPGGPVGKFAGLSGTEAIGRRQSAKEVAKETAKGATIGQVFKSAGQMSRPAATVGERAANLAKEGAAIGAGTYATEKGFGAPTGDAALSAATNVVLHGALGARRLRGQRNVEAPDRATEAVRPLRSTVEETVPPTVEGVGARPSELERIQGARQAEAQRQGVSPEQPVEAVEGQPVVSKVEAPQKYQHLQFGEVEVVPDQSGARPGRIKVAEVADPTKQHFVKKSDLQGRGNARMIPIKESAEVAPEPPVETSQQPSEMKGALPATLPSPETVRVEPTVQPEVVAREERRTTAERRVAEDRRTIKGSAPLTAEQQAAPPENSVLSQSLGKHRRFGFDVTVDSYLSGMGGTMPPLTAKRIRDILEADIQKYDYLPSEASRVNRVINDVWNKGEKPDDLAPLSPLAQILVEKNITADPWPHIYNKVLPAKLAQLEGQIVQRGPEPQSVERRLSERRTQERRIAKPETTSVEQGVELKTIKGDEAKTSQLSPTESRKVDRPAIVREERASAFPETEPKGAYFYHVTDPANVGSIITKGLRKDSTLADTTESAKFWQSELGIDEPLLLRVSRGRARGSERLYGGEATAVVSSKDIAPAHVEVWKDGKWRPLESVARNDVTGNVPGASVQSGGGGTAAQIDKLSTSSVSEGAQLPERGTIARSEPKVSEQPIKEVSDVTQKAEVKTPDTLTLDVNAERPGAGAQGTPAREAAPAPNIPERPETIQAQLESRGYSLIPEDTPRPSLPQGYRAEKTPDGVVYYDPRRIDAETIRSTPITELLGHVEPKSERTTEAVVARTPEGTELHSSAVSPENLQKQVEVTKANFPEAKIEAGKGVAEKVIEERLEPSITSARKETMSADRAELDLPQLPQAERKSWQSTLNKAKEQGTQRASILADEVLNSPRSLNEVETAQLVLRAQEIKNEHSRVMREIGNEKNPESIQTKRAEVEALEREFDKLTQATKASGTEKGRALASQKLTINQDYDPVSLVQRAKAAKGRDLTLDERVRYEGMAKEIESLTERLTKAEEELTSKRLQKEIDRVVRRGKRAETKKQLDDEFAMLAQQFAQARAQSKGIHSAGLAGLDPEGIYTPLIAKMAKNRIRAGVVKAEEVVDHVYEALDGAFSKRDIRDAISGYGLERKGKPRSEDVKELARVKSELRKLSTQEDIEAGKRLTPAEKTRQTNLLKQEADLTRRLEEKDFDRPERRYLTYNKETQAIESRVSKLKAQYERELYLAQRGKLGAAWDVGVNIANVPKSLKSMGDVSAVLRQGGYFSITHPVLSAKAGLDMLRSFSETGFKNVEREITSHRDFDLARRSGVDFTGVEKDNPNLSKREEAYLGGDIIDRAAEVPVAGKVVRPVKAVKDFSERTFVSFLDSQRMQVFSRFADHVRSLKMSQKEEAKALKAMANFVNIGTGRGSLGKSGNQIAPALNVLMFSPRLLASRVQLMNKMVNPVAIQRMPKGARSLMIKDNVKFAGTIATALGLAKAVGAGVSLDPDDADFLKIRIGDSRYDILTGLQQPMRFIYRMARAVQADITGDETYAGEGKGPLIERFARSKAAPLAGGVADYISGEDFKGRKFKLSRQLIDLVTPLYINDFKEAMEDDGVVGAFVKTSPALIGIGAQTYQDSPEKAHTHAEKLARKFVRAKMPDKAREEEQIDIDQAKASLRAKSRRGEDVTKELADLGASITSKQTKTILDARNKTRLQEDVNRLSALDAIIVWSVMNPGQQQETRSILERKASLIDNLPADRRENVRRRYQEAGIQAIVKEEKPTNKKTFSGFKRAFERRAEASP